jgi:hypothetical protein
MTVTEQLNAILDRLDAEESPDAYELAQLLKVLISSIELSHAQTQQRIVKLEQQVAALEKT